MAQTTGQTTAYNLKLELSTNGTVWTDASGSANKIEPSGGDRDVSETSTFGGYPPIVSQGPKKSIEVKISALYTEVTGESWEILRAAYEAGTSIYIRYSPKGGTTGNAQFTSGQGVVKTPVWPSADASDSKPMTFECTTVVPGFTKTTVA